MIYEYIVSQKTSIASQLATGGAQNDVPFLYSMIVVELSTGQWLC